MPSEIPGTSESGDPVALLAVADVAGVNALLPDQRLTFGDSGLTIIYGDNASGKSGYARLIRQAVTARDQGRRARRRLRQGQQRPEASFEYTVGENAATWSLDG